MFFLFCHTGSLLTTLVTTVLLQVAEAVSNQPLPSDSQRKVLIKSGNTKQTLNGIEIQREEERNHCAKNERQQEVS